jgi:hypothetical protein
MSLQPHHILLTVVAGESRSLQRQLAWGTPLPRLSVGSAADWEIRGEGILGVHFYLSFDGRRLRGMAASPGAKVLTHGVELGCDWEDLLLPFELGFGSARLAGHVVGNPTAGASLARRDFAPGQGRRTQPLDLARSDGLQTQLLDLSTLREPRLDAHVTLSVEGAPARAPRNPSVPSFQVVSGSTLAWSLGTLQVQPKPQPQPRPEPQATPRPEPPSVPPARPLTHTACDGGALHDYAQQLVARRPEAATAPARAGSTPPEAAAKTPARQLLPLLGRGWERARTALRSAPRCQRWLAFSVLGSLMLMLLPLSWATDSTPMGSPDATLQTQPPSASARSTLSTAEDSTAEAHEATRAPDLRAPGGDTETSRAAPSNRLIQADGGSSPTAPEPSTAAPEEVAPSSSLELDAFRAAFGGNVAEAIALYERLAKQRGAPMFQHAARSLRENRVQKP